MEVRGVTGTEHSECPDRELCVEARMQKWKILLIRVGPFGAAGVAPRSWTVFRGL